MSEWRAETSFKGRVGILGGSFDPIHAGHIQKVMDVRATLELRRVLLVPAWVAPYKLGGAKASAADRLRMVELAVSGQDGLEACDYEVRQEAVSYTIDTIEALMAVVGRPVLLVGADAYPTLPTWRWYQDLLRLADVAVMTRAGFSMPPPDDVFSAPTIWSSIGSNIWSHEGGLIVFVTTPDVDVSSTEVRRRIAADESLDGLVAPEVVSYIQKKGLYQKEKP